MHLGFLSEYKALGYRSVIVVDSCVVIPGAKVVGVVIQTIVPPVGPAFGRHTSAVARLGMHGDDLLVQKQTLVLPHE